VKDFIDVDGDQIEVRCHDLDNEDDLSAGADDATSPIRNLCPGDATSDLPLEPHVTGVGFEVPITPALVDRVAAVLTARPDLRLQIDQDVTDLDFLRDLPPVRDLTVILGLKLANVDALAAHAKTLTYLHLETGLRPLDVSVLGELQRLEQLYLRKSNRTLKGVETALSSLPQVQHLTLHSVTLKDPNLLRSLTGLRGLAFKLGANRDLTFLPSIRSLWFLEIWGTPKLNDISPLAQCAQLQALYLQDLPHAVLPNMANAASLTDVRLNNLPQMSGQLGGLAAAPKLRYLHAYRCGLTAADVETLRGHPTLQGVFLPDTHRGDIEDHDPTLGLPRPLADRPFMRAAGVMALPARVGETFSA
jgi:hypothetical protein